MTVMMLFLSLLIILQTHLGVIFFLSFCFSGEQNRETHKGKQDWLSLIKF